MASRKSSGPFGVIILVAMGALVAGASWCIDTAKTPAGQGVLGSMLLGLVVFVFLNRRKKERLRKERWERLVVLYGEQDARRILEGTVWQGETEEQVVESLGQPVEVDEKVLKTKTKRTLKYNQTGQGRFATRVLVENGVVVGWETK